MQYRLFNAAGIVVIAALMILSARAADAQTVAAGPYYATPLWDQTIPCLTTANCSRFVVLSNFNLEAVLDRDTGLVWQRAASVRPGVEIEGNWSSALEYCRDSSTGNRRGWRLPKVEELVSLLDASTGNLPAGNPFDYNTATFFWTSTSLLTIANQAYAVRFGIGPPLNPIVPGPKTFNGAGFWCVRGGPGLDVQ